MSGEKSKGIGELGEKVVYNLLRNFGWTPILENIDIECQRPEYHKRPSKAHGVDYIKHYNCPLYTDTQKTVTISAKYYKDYPKNPKTKTKEFLLELAQSMNCLKFNKTYGRKKLSKSTKEVQLRGLLFYLNHNEDFNDSIIEKLGSYQFPADMKFDPLFIVDNKRASFFYSAIEFYKTKDLNNTIKFAYPTTEFNMDSFENCSYGRILPLEFIVSDILPMRIDHNDQNKELLLFTNNSFSKDNLSRLISFTKNFTSSWSSKITILYPNYRESKNSQEVSEVLMEIEDFTFANSINVNSFPITDFRKLEEITHE